MRSLRLPLAGLLAVLPLLGCSSGELDGSSSEELARPLFSSEITPRLLVESRELAPPPSLAANRFVTGWRATPGDSARLSTQGNRARLEIVDLGGATREVRFDLGDRTFPEGLRIGVRVDQGELIHVDLQSPLRIPVVAPIRGAFPIDLELPDGLELEVAAAEIAGARPAGLVRLDDAFAVSQAGTSALEIVRDVLPGTRLRGTFVPPASASEGQGFWLEIENQDGIQRVFDWTPGWRPGSSSQDLEIGLGSEHQLVRIRLGAEGTGNAAIWQNLRLVDAPSGGVESAPPTTPVTRLESIGQPRLVIVYVLDALRSDAVGHLAGSAQTATLDRLASQGATLVNHRSVAPNTLPSTKALFTGFTERTRGGWKLPGDGPPTLAESFAAAGFETGLFSANPYVSSAYGLDRGFDFNGESQIGQLRQQRRPYNDSGERVQAVLLEWLASPRDPASIDSPRFAYVHTLNPHNPYDPPRKYLRSLDLKQGIDGSTETLRSIIQHRKDPSAAEQDTLRQLYDSGVRYADDLLAELVEWLDENYSKGEVLLIVTSDHGDEFFEHDGLLHGYSLWQEQVAIPLIAWWPGVIPAGTRIDTLTDTLDVHRSLANLADQSAGATPALWPELLGQESSAKRSPGPHFAAASSVKGGIFSAVSGGWKLIWAPRTGTNYGQGEGRGRQRDAESLYDLVNDPGEHDNLAGQRSLVGDWLRGHLTAWIDADSPSVNDSPEVIDEDTRKRLRSLGYVE